MALLTAYSEMLPTLTAEQQLAGIEAASAPHMSTHARRETLRGLARLVGRSERSKPASSADLKAMGIKVQEVTRG